MFVPVASALTGTHRLSLAPDRKKLQLGKEYLVSRGQITSADPP